MSISKGASASSRTFVGHSGPDPSPPEGKRPKQPQESEKLKQLVLVDVPDEKTPLPSPRVQAPLVSNLKMMLARSGGKRGKLKSLRTYIWAHFSVNGVAGVALTSVTSIQPGSQCPNWTALASVYDECRLRAVIVKWKTFLIAGTMTGAGLDCHGCVVVDPGVSGVLTSIADSVDHTWHSEVAAVSTFGGMSPFDAEKWMGVNGGKPVPVPAPIIESGITADLVGGGWFPCTTGSTAICGYIKPYIEASSAPGTAQFRISYLMGCDMEFRSRG